MVDEEDIIAILKSQYKKALDDVNERIKALLSDELTQSKIYQLQFQEALKSQLNSILDKMNNENYKTIDDYLKNCYENGFVGTIYDLQGQGIPLIFPISQEQLVNAILNDTKLSKNLYDTLGFNVDVLKTQVNAEISRGIASGMNYTDIARNVLKRANIGLNKAIRIVRTEGHRVTQQATFDAQKKAVENGAKVVKQWDSTMDKRTRKSHTKLDGQIRQLEEPFESGGHKAMFPSAFGVPSEDINCRCVSLQRATWALSDDEYIQAFGKARESVEVKGKSFDEFKKNYENEIKARTFDIEKGTTKLKSSLGKKDYEAYLKMLNENNNSGIKALYAKYADDLNGLEFTTKRGQYNPRLNHILYTFPKYSDINRFATLAHEYGHFFDTKVDAFGKFSFKEIDGLNEILYGEFFRKQMCFTDDFLEAVRKDKDFLAKIYDENVKNDLLKSNASAGVQDALNCFQHEIILWGHDEKYWSSYSRHFKALKLLRECNEMYKNLGMKARVIKDSWEYLRDIQGSVEVWANVMRAIVVGGDDLKYVSKYLPNSYEKMIEMLKGVK